MGITRNWRQGATDAGNSGGARPAEALHRRALEAWQGGDWRLALETATKALGRNGRSADLHYLVGACHFKAGQYEPAAAAFGRAAQLAQGQALALRSEVYAALSECRCGRGSQDLAPAPAPKRFAPVSIIICSVDDHKFGKVAADYQRLYAGHAHEIIRIDDARSLAEGYNRGIERARGELLLFSHDDVRIVNRDFGARCFAHLDHCDLLGIAGSAVLSGGSWVSAGWPHLAGQIGADESEAGTIAVNIFGTGPALVGGMQALDGVLLFARRALAQELRFDQETFDGWHLYDIDFSYRAALAGHRVATANDVLVVHASGGRFGAKWKHYERRFLKKYEDELVAIGTTQQEEHCSVILRTDEEWRALTATRLARHAATPPTDTGISAAGTPGYSPAPAKPDSIAQTSQDLFPRPPGGSGQARRVLNVGGGSKSIPLPPHFDNWEQLLLDIDPRAGADLVCDARTLRESGTAGPGAFDAVYCSHNLEHYYRHDVDKVLRGFLHVLKAGGFAEIRVPDIGELVKLLARMDLDLEQEIYRAPVGSISAHDMIYGYGPEIETSGRDFYTHKTGFSAASLVRVLRANGFGEIFLAAPVAALELHVFAFKTKADAATRAALDLLDPVAAPAQPGKPAAAAPQPMQSTTSSAAADPVEALYQRAAAAWSGGDWTLAAALCDQALALEPDLPALHYLQGCCRMEQEQHQSAAQSFQRCLELRPKQPLLGETLAQQAQCRVRIEHARAQGKRN